MKSLARCTTAFIAAALLIGAANAQTPEPGAAPSTSRPAAGAGQQRMRLAPVDQAPSMVTSKQSLSAKGAQAMIDAIVAEATSKRQAVSVAIVDEGGNLLAFKRMDNTSLGTIQAAMTKAVSALKLQMPSGAFSQEPGAAISFMSAGFTVLGGGEPIKVGNTVVGAIAVSGADDMAYVAVGLKAFKP